MAKEKTKERKKRSKRKERKVKRKQDGVIFITHLKTARAHVRRKLPCACSFSEAGTAAAEIVGGCFPQCAKDFALWAWYCRHFDRRRIVERAYYYASCERQGEVRDVLDGKTWRMMKVGKRGFNKRLAKICSLLGSHPLRKSSL